VIAPFDYHAPTSLEEVFALLEEHGDAARPIAGGTALVNLMKLRLVRPAVVVSLQGIEELHGISRDNGHLCIAAMTTHREAETSPLVQTAAPLLAETLRHVATIRIRNVATLGGNVAHADPNQDPPVALIALGASLGLNSSDGRRTVPVESFFTDYYETVLRPAELVTEVLVPELPRGFGSTFLKFLPRSMDDYATVSVAAALRLDEGGDRVDEVRVAVGSAASVPVRAERVEAAVLGQAPTDAVLREAAAEVRAEVEPLADGRGSAEYKCEMAEVFVYRAIREAVARAGANGGPTS
jgi:carbon-monoxide dehydrogenase medium subunit